MGAVVRENEIAFFRYRNRLAAGICLKESQGKARFAISRREAVNVPLGNVLLRTGEIAAGHGEAEKWWERASVDSVEIDLEELWQVVQEEENSWRVEDLADFYYGDSATTRQIAAMLLHLDESFYFDTEGTDCRPLSQDEVSARVASVEKAEARSAEREQFCQWFSDVDDSVEVEPSILEKWSDQLKGYVLLGDRSPNAAWVKRMLGGDQATTRKAFDRLVTLGIWQADEHLDLIRYEIPVDFSSGAEDRGKSLQLAEFLSDGHRKDLTGLPVVTIDDASTTDMDDGLSLVFQEDGSCQVGVHITDMAALIEVGSELDREAASRISSLYFPDRKVPMFPVPVSEVLGSLQVEEIRLAVSLLFSMTADGQVGDPEIVPSYIRCREKLSYDSVDGILEDTRHPNYSALSALHRGAEANWIGRLTEGAIAVAHLERRVQLMPDGEIRVTVRPRNSRSDLLVSEWMVMANVAIARHCRDREIPIVYRTQQAPDLSEVETTDNEVLHRYQVLTKMRPAKSTVEPEQHSGLGVDAYCQVSSPLRRFVDLTNQRQLVASLRNQPVPYNEDAIKTLAFQTGERMRQLARIERQRGQYWLYKYFSASRGRSFEAMVLDVRERLLRVELLEYGLQVDVRVSADVIPGECVQVRLGRCDPWADEIVFSLE